jgi:hypothetical protein
VDGRRVLSREPHPGLLDRVVGIGMRSEHAVRDRAEPVALDLERLGDHVGRTGVVHVAAFPGWSDPR